MCRDALELDASSMGQYKAPTHELVRPMRASILLLGPAVSYRHTAASRYDLVNRLHIPFMEICAQSVWFLIVFGWRAIVYLFI